MKVLHVINKFLKHFFYRLKTLSAILFFFKESNDMLVNF